MSEISKTSVHIFGRNYIIKGDAEPEYILKLAEYVDKRMKEISDYTSEVDTIKIAILTALNIADEYFQMQKQSEDKVYSDFDLKIQQLSDKLDRGLKGTFSG